MGNYPPQKIRETFNAFQNSCNPVDLLTFCTDLQELPCSKACGPCHARGMSNYAGCYRDNVYVQQQ
jgi:hypothetical protein